MVGIFEIFVAVISFVAGRFFLLSEKVIEQKRTVYANYLRKCITAQDAYKNGTDDEMELDNSHLAPDAEFFLYASVEVIIWSGRHIASLEKAFAEIDKDTEALHPAFQESIKLYNTMLSEMRKDVLGWSYQGIKERLIGSPKARVLLAEDDK